MKKPKVIAFAGLDGSGKTTQIQAIRKLLEATGYKVKVQQHFASSVGKKCQDIIRESKDPHIRALAFALDEYSQKLDNNSDTNYDVILCDRSHYCAYAYSGAQGISEDWINWLYMYSQEYDICIFLDITLNTSYTHKGFDSVSPSLSEAQYNQVRANYLRMVNSGQIIRVDAEQVFETVTEQIKTIIYGVLEKRC